MMNKINFLFHIVGLRKRHHSAFDKRIIHPVREWTVGLILFLLIVIVGGMQSAFLFVAYRNLSTDGGTYEEPVAKYNAILVENMLKNFGEKKAAYEALQETASARNMEIPVASGVSTTSIETIASSTASTTTTEVIEETEVNERAVSDAE